MAGQERGGKGSSEFFRHYLTVTLKNIVLFSLITAEIKQFFDALMSGVDTLHVSDFEKLKF